MECVGRRVKKVLAGRRTVFGLVRRYEQTTGFCKIVYDCGDSEEVHLSEVSSLLVPVETPPLQLSESDAEKPNKRRCVMKGGKDDDNPVIRGSACGSSLDGNDYCGECELNSNKGFDLNEAAVCNLNDDDDDDGHGCNEVGGGHKLRGLDLNVAVDLELGEGLCLNRGVVEERLGMKKEVINLNLDANEGSRNLGGGREVRCFDLNLQCTEDDEMNLDLCVGQVRANESVCGKGVEPVRAELADDDTAGKILKPDGDEGNVIVNVEKKRDDENLSTQSVKRKRRVGKRNDASNNDDELLTTELPQVDLGARRRQSELESREGPTVQNGIDCVIGIPQVATKGRRVSKRKELLENDKALPPPNTGLRRSSCGGKRAAVSNPDQNFDAPRLDAINNQFSSPGTSGVSDEMIMVAAGGKLASSAQLPPKVELPPPSCNLDLNGVSAFEFVSIYAFLRSFSTLLLLSPFEFDDFVSSVKSNDSTLLFDAIHVALLRTLRKHLESLSDEGSKSASDCLRSLNWDFLDLITWPMFLVEYLLLHSPGYIPSLDACQLKHFQIDYFEQPVSSKVDILQRLCDDITETEAFRAEINRRALATDRPTYMQRNVNFNSSSKKKAAKDLQDADRPADGNSDECCLCRMDGNLICCDGCPAAFHSRCVGVVSSLLPEGNWYCPECVMEKDKPWMRLRNSIRGADLLGTDPYGREYYSSCGYLLVIESCNYGYSSQFYNRNDLAMLIKALESSQFIYDSIIQAICKQWNITLGVCGASNDLDDCSYSVQSGFPENRQLLEMHPAPSESLNNNEAFSEDRSNKKLMVPSNSSFTEQENAGQDTDLLETDNHGVRLETYLARPEGSADVSLTSIKADALNENGVACSEKCHEIPDCCHSPGKLVNAGDQYVASTFEKAEKGKDISLESYRCVPNTINSGRVLSQVYYGANYVNYYEFAKSASSYFEELSCKSSVKTSEDAAKSIEETIAGQLKVVCNRFLEFSWSNIHTSNMDSRRERCGWCLHCRDAEEEKGCLFIMNDSIPAVENYTCDALGIWSRKNSKNHLVDIKCHVICIESHLHGLLSGPWLNSQYSMHWRESVLGANDISSVKNLLVKLESNIHHQALSAEWKKHVDSAVTMCSGYHFVSSSARAPSRKDIAKKGANQSKVDTAPSSKAAPGMSLFWWRGGRVSCVLFNWKVLPCSLASKAARQGGCKKIPGILYPENGDYAKRTKYVSWRAAVETSRSVEQLALQVRELDANVRWNDIGNSSLLSKLGKDAKKTIRSFKKVIIRRKCSEGAVVRYLLDFGKRRILPDVVVKHGTILEDTSHGRKKYWLEESHVPLHLLKAFEEKRIARKSNSGNPGKLGESIAVNMKPFKNKGFFHLFSRAERSENSVCGHCNKNVPIREAVSCCYCQGIFHEKHIQKSAESINAECTYACHKCMGGKFVKIVAKKRESVLPKVENASKGLKPLCIGKRKKRGNGRQPLNSKKTSKVTVVPLRRSARNVARIARLSLQNAKVKTRKRYKKDKSEKGVLKKLKDRFSKKKRTPVNSSFWLNGIRLSRRLNDDRPMDFRSRMLVLSGEVISDGNKPKCSLCKEMEYNIGLNYVACEICGAWFHGDALDLTTDKIENIIGFKCHMCLNKRPPLCPHHFSIGSNEVLVSANDPENSDAGAHGSY